MITGTTEDGRCNFTWNQILEAFFHDIKDPGLKCESDIARKRREYNKQTTLAKKKAELSEEEYLKRKALKEVKARLYKVFGGLSRLKSFGYTKEFSEKDALTLMEVDKALRHP